MATEKQKNASRANGAKSKGPTTPEGKARVAQNPIRHGLASKAVVLSNESTEEYEALAASYRDQWQPKNQTEDDVVSQLINAQWRLRRIAAMETATFDLEMELRRKDLDRDVPDASAHMRQSDAFLSVSIDNGLAVDQLSRYETRYSNLYHRALRTLLLLRRPQNGGNASYEPPAQASGERNCTSKPEPEPPASRSVSSEPPAQASGERNCTSKPEPEPPASPGVSSGPPAQASGERNCTSKPEPEPPASPGARSEPPAPASGEHPPHPLMPCPPIQRKREAA